MDKDKENSSAVPDDQPDDERAEQSDDQEPGSDGEGASEAEAEDQGDDSANHADGTVAVAGNNEAAVQEEQPAAQPQQQQQQFSMWGVMKTLVVRMIFIYAVSSFLRRGQTPAPQESASQGPRPMTLPASNIFPTGTLMDMYVYVSEEKVFKNFSDLSALFWHSEELEYGDWTSGSNGDGIFTRSGQIPISEKIQNNGTLYLHIYIVKSGQSPDPKNKEKYVRRDTIYKFKELTKLKKRRYHKMKNLLTGTSQVQADLLREHNESSYEIVSHWHPNLTINIIDDHTAWTKGSIPSPLDEFIDFVPDSTQYYPIVYFNDYWNLNSEYMPINSTTPVLNLTLTYQPLSLFKWQMYAAQGMKNRWYSFLGDDVVEGSDEDQDSLKSTFVSNYHQAFLETSPYLLGITVIVSIVHSIFEFLAFKNDIQFWRNRKSLEGLSVRSVFFNVFQSVIVLLYVLDNETNFVIKISIFVGLAIEIWKIHKVIDIKVDRENKLFGVIPRVWFADKSTYAESPTKEYDRMAFKYLSWLLFPLLGCYAVYSILYLEHKGWYSWVLGMMYGFLLTFGFITMTPQLFINYKLKSVAHLPWRMLTYKALNTFIDDLFAFVIKMPMLYRLGCFRDDIIFLIYVYQRWIYRVDPKRMNEFGTSGEMMDEQNSLQNGNTVGGAIEASANQERAEGEVMAPPAKSASQNSGLKQRPTKNKHAKKAD